MQIAFDSVCDAEHWKNPIDSECEKSNRALIEEAIRYFTATVPTFKELPNGKLRVQAKGYRLGPAGDF